MTKELREKIFAIIQDMCFMDDLFFSCCFNDNISCVQYILRIIMDKQDLIVKTAKTQYTIENVYGRGVRLDVFAEDSAGKLYNIEIQKKDEGAVAQRARYNSSMLDVNNLEKGANFNRLPDTFIIFITENDVLRGGKQIYHIERVIKETGQNFGDGSKIIYVNGSIRVGSLLGDLMHDFFCKDPSQMKHSPLAACALSYKGTKREEFDGMSDLMEKFLAEERAEGKAEGRAEGKAEGKLENLLENIRTLIKSLGTAEAAMNLLEIPPEKQKELAPLT